MTARGSWSGQALWGRVEELFHAALARTVSGRRDFLATACQGNEKLRREVVSLLDAHDEPEAFNEAAATELARRLTREADPRKPDVSRPERIGPYRLLKVLGEGGMGTVYLAEQSDPLPRQVALKLMRWGGADGEMVRRFELEREALARMSHPNVAQVFDAGATEHGQPYFVLEYIPGLSITEYCDARRLDLRARLDLLTAVCEGVRHAHEKGVIHRDLKPSNILVSDTPNGPLPKIIDFGIAKALEPWGDTVALATASRLRVGSPGYISPEAVIDGGGAIDTRSDVYSLGVVLCELLVGARPFETPDFHRQGQGRTVDPPRPSQRLRGLPPEKRREVARGRRLDESKLVRQLRGELDWIVLRAIAIEPSKRYSSVAELAADIRRWATRQPVEARPPSFTYRARKALRRHAVLFTAACLLLTTLISFSARSNILHARAEAARAEAEELVSFMLNDLSTHLQPLGRLDLLESVSRKSLAYFESSASGNLHKAGRGPAAALRQIGQVLATRGDLDAAFEAYDQARGLDQSRLAERPSDPSRRFDLVDDLKLLSRVHQARGEAPIANSCLDEAEEHLRRVTAEVPGHPAARLALADTLARHTASLRAEHGDVEGARALFGEALTILKDLLKSRPGDPEVRFTLGDAYYGLGMLTMYSLGDPEAAIRHLEAGIAVFRELVESQPEVPAWRYRLAVLSGQGLSATYGQLERLPEAQAANREALTLLEVLVREEPSNGRWSHGLGWELIRQGLLARSSGDLDAAARAYRRSAEVQAALVARATGAHSNWLDGLAVAYAALAEVQSEAGHFEEALEVAEAALTTRRRMLSSDEDGVSEEGGVSEEDGVSIFNAMDLASTGVMLAGFRARHGDVQGALELLDEAGGIMERLAAADLDDSYVQAQIADLSQRRGELLRNLDR